MDNRFVACVSYLTLVRHLDAGCLPVADSDLVHLRFGSNAILCGSAIDARSLPKDKPWAIRRRQCHLSHRTARRKISSPPGAFN